MIREIRKVLNNAQNIALTTHRNADGDALGSMLAMHRVLVLLGKDVQMFLDDDIQASYSFMPGIELIKKNYDGWAADLWIILDIDSADNKRLGVEKQLIAAPILNIDHHVTNGKTAECCFLDSQAAATGELVWRIAKWLHMEHDEIIAGLVFVAVVTDCGFFRFANTNAETFRVAGELVECGAKPHIIARELEKRSLASFQALTRVLETLELYAEGKVAVAVITSDVGEQIAGGNEIVINNLRAIEGVETAVVLKEKMENEIRASIRTHEQNAVKIAQCFGGGGHLRAAGCTIHGTLSEAKEKILGVILGKLCGQ